jgi:hypothetical protein
LPVHSHSVTHRPPAITIANASSLYNRGFDRNLQKKIPRNFTQTKLKGPLESTKGREKQAKTKLSEADKIGIGKKAPGGRTTLPFTVSALPEEIESRKFKGQTSRVESYPKPPGQTYCRLSTVNCGLLRLQ